MCLESYKHENQSSYPNRNNNIRSNTKNKGSKRLPECENEILVMPNLVPNDLSVWPKPKAKVTIFGTLAEKIGYSKSKNSAKVRFGAESNKKFGL